MTPATLDGAMSLARSHGVAGSPKFAAAMEAACLLRIMHTDGVERVALLGAAHTWGEMTRDYVERDSTEEDGPW